jgi:hypothetical protein
VSILTLAEAAAALRITPVPDEENSDPVLDMVLPGVDDYLKTATGHDWAADAVIDPGAKMAAIMLLVMWYEDPAMIGEATPAAYGLNSQIEQLRVKAAK